MKLLLYIFAVVAGAMADGDLEEILKAGNDQFTANMFQAVVESAGDKSCVLSAFSVLSPLAQLALASVGESHDDILKVIGFPNDNVTKEVFKDVNARLRSVKGVDLKQANKVYIRNKYSLNDQFAVVSKDVFNSEVQNIDFDQNDKAAAEINAWVEDNTNHRIKNLVDPESIDGSTTAILVNAIYFKGKWKKPFEPSHTTDRTFHVTKDKTVTMKMMYKNDDVKYAEVAELDAKFIELPYEGDETSLVIALPNQVDGINTLIEKLSDPAALNKALESMNFNEVDITLPRFKIETTTNLKEVLEKMNIKKLFSPSFARLDNFLKETSDLYVSDATQKAFIEVNEEGAEAAAANQFNIAYLSAVISEPKQFVADHPYVFYLRKEHIILFNGVVKS